MLCASFLCRYFGFDAGDPIYDTAGAAAHLNKQFGKLALDVRKEPRLVYRRRRAEMGKKECRSQGT